jgi:large subunit ribosomal protein L32e
MTKDENVQLDQRNHRNRTRPAFHRQEWFRYKRVGDHWRKPRGIHSKLRRHYSGEQAFVSVGYRGPRAARGKHPSGFEEIMVFSPKDLDSLDPKRQAVRIGHSVGYLKRMHIALRADEMNIRILNFSRETHDELLAEAKKRGIELPKEGGK